MPHRMNVCWTVSRGRNTGRFKYQEMFSVSKKQMAYSPHCRRRPALVVQVTLQNMLDLQMPAAVFSGSDPLRRNSLLSFSLPLCMCWKGLILRSILSFGIGKLRATQIAVNSGKFISLGFIALSFFFNPILIFIGAFVWIAGNQEYQYLKFSSGQRFGPFKDYQREAYSVFEYANKSRQRWFFEQRWYPCN